MATTDPGRATHRTRLLEAARTLLRARDYGTITARDLVEASNTNLGSIGYHFGSKEALLNEAIGLAFEEWADRIIELANPGDPLDPTSFLASLRHLLDEFDSVRPYFHAFIEALARSARSPELRQQLAAHYQSQRQRVERWLADSVAGGISFDERWQVASVMLAVSDGLLMQRFVDPDNPGTSDAVVNALAHALAQTAAR